MHEPDIDGLGRTVRCSQLGQEREHISGATLQSPSQTLELDELGRQIRCQSVDDHLQELLALSTIYGSVGGHDVLIDSPGDFDFGETRVGEEAGDPLLLFGRE
ncbi:hypothetical protein GCM10009700_13490 [Brevibacterium sanguinis]